MATSVVPTAPGPPPLAAFGGTFGGGHHPRKTKHRAQRSVVVQGTRAPRLGCLGPPTPKLIASMAASQGIVQAPRCARWPLGSAAIIHTRAPRQSPAVRPPIDPRPPHAPLSASGDSARLCRALISGRWLTTGLLVVAVSLGALGSLGSAQKGHPAGFQNRFHLQRARQGEPFRCVSADELPLPPTPPPPPPLTD